MNESTIEREIQAHERIARLEEHSTNAFQLIEKVSDKIERQGDQIVENANQILQITRDMSKNNEQTNKVISSQTRKMVIAFVVCIVFITLGIVLNSPEKIPALIKNSLDFL